MSCDKYYRVWADVDLNAIRSNIEKISSVLTEGTRLCAVIKADAYGHGSCEVANAIKDQADFFAVATMEEALELRQAGISKPVLILGYVHPSYAVCACENDIRLTVFDLNTAKILSEAVSGCGKKLKIHIKIDTGMSRIGFAPEKSSVEDIKSVCSLPGLEAEGMFTHFARSDEGTDKYVKEQFSLFKYVAEALKAEGIDIALKHCSNSAAATNFRETDMDMVRLGVSMYGMYPSDDVHQIELEPALSLKSHVVMVKHIRKGTCVGYGGTWQAEKDSVIATVPVGYADGYHRLLSNKGIVLIKGRRYPVIGRVCMDQIMVDVSEGENDIPVCQGDEAVLIGRSGDAVLTAEEVAGLAQTINYEITCSISPRVPRRYTVTD